MTGRTTAGTTPTSTPTDDQERTRWQAFWVCVGVAALTILDLSKVNVGLPSIEESLGAGSTDLQLIVAGYALAFGLALVPAGRLGDIRSRRLMFVVGLSSFTVASLLCAIAPDVKTLVAARILQGVAAGIQMPQVLGLIQQLFQGEERARAFGLFGAVVGIATAFGPTLGGLLIQLGGPEDGWRLLFWMNIPLGIVAIAFALKLLPRKQARPQQKTGLDPVGVVLLAIATFSLMLPFVLTTGGPDDDPLRWIWLAAAVVAAALFVAWERRYERSGKSPVVHFALFTLSSYRNGILIATAYFAAIPAVFLLTTLYLQQGLGLAPVFAGMVSIPFALSSAVTAWIGGRLVSRLGRQLVVIGLAIVAVGITLLLLAAVLTPQEVTPWAMAAAMLVAGVGAGFVISPNQTLTLAEIPVTEGGVAGSMAQVGQRVGTAVGVAAASATFFSTLYAEAAGGGHASLSVYHDGFRNGFLVTIALVAVALTLGLVDLGQRRRRRERAATA
ncbi:MFS transporter [Clavibacter michiganensis]|uniref:MFS transporter n=1 Tax=Clavibacter michiganensis TaxID=28447 RepID=UPI0026DC3EB1|nr:MFS transporter [Clavibacter michiganensis]MDO4141822.1 MFS transporter [Clavibacter michiganensis]